MKCKYCGNDLGEDAVFCNNCGKKAESIVSLKKEKDSLNITQDSDINYAQEENNAENQYIPYENTENHDKNNPEQESEYFSDTIYENEHRNEKTGILKLTGSFFVMILATVLFAFVSICFCVKLGVSGKTSADAVRRMKTSILMDTDTGEKSFSDSIYDFIKFGNINDEGITKAQFRDFMVNSDFLEFAAEKTELYVDYIINGKGTEPTVTTDEMTEFFRNNEDVSEESFGYKMQTGDYNAIRRQLERNEADSNLLISSWSVRTGFNFGKLNYAFQYITLGILAALTIVFFIWIAVIVDRKGKYILWFYGNIFLFSGIIVFLAGFAVVFGLPLAYIHTESLACYAGSAMLIPFSLFAVSTGLFQICVGIILKSIKKFFRRREKRSQEIEKALAAANV